MIRPVLVGAMAAAVVALSITPALAAAYKVTATAPSTADVGALFKVKGKSSAGKTLSIQLRSGSSWKTVSTVKTASNGTYTRSVKMASVGAKKYRVVAPAKGAVKTGVSPTLTVTGFTWLPLAKQSHVTYTSDGSTVFTDVVGRVGATSYSHSILTRGSSGVTSYFNVDGRCDKLNLGLGLDSRFPGSVGTTTYAGGFGTGYSSGDYFDIVPTATLVKAEPSIDSRADTLYLGRIDGGSGVTAFTTPKVHCSITSLPAVDPLDVS